MMMSNPANFEVRTVEIAGKPVNMMEHGYLFNRDEWNPEYAEFLAKVDGITLTAWHWWLIGFLRSYYNEFQIVPARRVIRKALDQTRDLGNPKTLQQLFPDVTLLPAYSGMPYSLCIDIPGKVPRYRGIGRKADNLHTAHS